MGSWREMLLSWGAKNAFIVVIVWVMQRPLPGLVESFAYGEKVPDRQGGRGSEAGRQRLAALHDAAPPAGPGKVVCIW